MQKKQMKKKNTKNVSCVPGIHGVIPIRSLRPIHTPTKLTNLHLNGEQTHMESID